MGRWGGSGSVDVNEEKRPKRMEEAAEVVVAVRLKRCLARGGGCAGVVEEEYKVAAVRWG